jgi:hypothetical protein
MKKTPVVSVGIAFVLAITFSLHAETTIISIQSLRSASAGDLEVMLQAIEEMTPLPAESIPPSGTFWSAQHLKWPPIPININHLDAWNFGNGVYLLDDLDFDYQAKAQSTLMMRAMAGDVEDNTSYSNTYTFDTNGLWLDIKNVADGLADLNLHHATNEVYAIWGTTDLLAAWNVVAEVWPTNSAVMPFTAPTLDRQSLFLRAEDWTGVDSDGDGIPDWWIWKYFGNLSENATNLDSQGNLLLDDYQNGIDPNIITFTLSVTNLYVNQTIVPLQINLQGGIPSSMAVLVNDTNHANANWQAYTGTNITVNLGSTDGVYAVWVGLRGLPADAQQTWDTGDILFTLDRVPPTIVVTNPVNAANAFTARPYLQLQGYGQEPLSIISFDLTNAAGLFTNQPGLVTDQVFDTNRFDFTTNFFQCYDIPLTNGLNTITLRATDRASNLTITNVTITLDYSLATNPPTINLIWPQDGMQISGASFTLRGMLDDETAQVAAQIVDANGNTNTVEGLVERGGMFWVENLPLTNGDNTVTVTATDAAGNVTVTNLTVSESDVVLTIDGTPTGDDLYQPQGGVYGTVSDPDYTVWVNGIEATIDYWPDRETWYWQADNVPIHGKGTATFDAVAYPASSSTSPVNTSAEVEMGPYWNIVSHDCNKDEHYSDNDGIRSISSWTKIFTAEYQPNDGEWKPTACNGTETSYHLSCHPGGCDWNTWAINWTDTDATAYGTDSDGNNYTNHFVPTGHVETSVPDAEAVPGPFIYHYCAKGASYSWDYNNGAKMDVAVSAQTAVKLYTGGKANISRQNLFRINCWADRYDQPLYGPWLNTPITRLDSTSLQVLGKTPDSDGNVWIVLPDNSEQYITVTAPANHYNANAGASKCLLEVSLAPDEGVLVATNPDTYLVSYCDGAYVTVSASPPCDIDKVLPAEWHMDGGLPYRNGDGKIDPTKRLVDRSQIGIQTITATAAGSSKSIKIIVYQAKIEIDADVGDCLLTQHAWWNLSVEPSDVYQFLNTAAGTDLSQYLGTAGYYGEENDPNCNCPGCQGSVETGQQPIRGTNPQQYYTPTGSYWWCISIGDLVSALTVVKHLENAPGTYIIDMMGGCVYGGTHDCVSVANDIGSAAHVSTEYSSWNACSFSDSLYHMYTNSPPVCGCN